MIEIPEKKNPLEAYINKTLPKLPPFDQLDAWFINQSLEYLIELRGHLEALLNELKKMNNSENELLQYISDVLAKVNEAVKDRIQAGK